MSVARAMREIDSAEFADWMAYYRIEPFGERMSDLRTGIIAATVANANRGKKQKALHPIDFLPWAKPAAEPVRLEDPKAQAKFVALAVFGIELPAAGAGKFTVRRKSKDA